MNLAMVKRNFDKFCHLLIIGIEILTGRYKKSGANERLALISIEIQLKMKADYLQQDYWHHSVSCMQQRLEDIVV